MDELKHFIEQNRSQFDDCEPMDGHFDRFMQKLEADKRRTIGPSRSQILKIAAVAVIALVLGTVVAGTSIHRGVKLIETEMANVDREAPMKLVERTTRYVKAKVEPEYSETQKYYISLVDNRLDEIRKTETVDEKQKAELLKEMSEMDELFINLHKELKANPDNEVLIDAMINHYQTKIEVLNQIITNLNGIKQLNTKQDEKNVDL